jgi:hypothetical protein
LSSTTKNIGRMMGLVSTAEQELSPRQKLRVAIDAHVAAQAELDMLEKAADWSGIAAKRVGIAEDDIAAAKLALETAKEAAADLLVNRSLGLEESGGMTVQEARAALQTAQDNLEAAQAARATLKSRIPDAQGRADHTGRRVDDAAMAVVIAEVAPHSSKVWAEADRIGRIADDLREQVDYLSRWNIITPSDQPQRVVTHDAGADVWRQALAALKQNADAQLPPIPGAAMAPAKR